MDNEHGDTGSGTVARKSCILTATASSLVLQQKDLRPMDETTRCRIGSEFLGNTAKDGLLPAEALATPGACCIRMPASSLAHPSRANNHLNE